MTEQVQPGQWGEGVVISPPALYSLQFEWRGSSEPDMSTAQTEFSLGVFRFHPLKLGVQFGAAVVDVPKLTARAVFRMVISLLPDSPEAENPDVAFKQFACRVAPLTIYPFVREAITSAAMKAQLPGMVLPIANVGALFTPDEITIPAAVTPVGVDDEDEPEEPAPPS